MILLYVIIYFIFWILYYIIEGIHDANVILWQQSTISPTLTNDQKLLSTKHRLEWHEYDAYEKGLTHIALTLPIFLIGGGWLLAISLLILSLSIRLLVHNYCINKFMGIDINHIGTTDLFDLFMKHMADTGISQWTIKFGLLGLSIILVILFLLI